MINNMKYQRKNIADFHGYQIDTNGKVWSCWKKHYYGGIRGSASYMGTEWRTLKPRFNKGGYREISLRYNGKNHFRTIHRLVLETFVGPRPKGMWAAHNNGVRDDNRFKNLRWDTPKNNHADKKKHGTWGGGEKHNMAKLTKEEVLSIRKQFEFGASQRELAEMFRVARRTINGIVRHETWDHI